MTFFGTTHVRVTCSIRRRGKRRQPTTVLSGAIPVKLKLDLVPAPFFLLKFSKRDAAVQYSKRASPRLGRRGATGERQLLAEPNNIYSYRD